MIDDLSPPWCPVSLLAQASRRGGLGQGLTAKVLRKAEPTRAAPAIYGESPPRKSRLPRQGGAYSGGSRDLRRKSRLPRLTIVDC